MPISPGFSIDYPKRGFVSNQTDNYFGSSTYGEYVTGNNADNLIFTFGLHDFIKGYGGI